MATRLLEYLLGFKTQDAKKAQQDIKGVAKASKEVETSQERVASTAKKVNQELANINKRRRDFERVAQAYKNTALSMDDLGFATAKTAKLMQRMGATESEIRGVVRSLGQGTTEAQALAIALDKAEKNALDLANTNFSDVSRRQALAGDFQSNLGAVRGLAGTAGLSGVGEGVGVAGEIVVLAEELPRLKAAAQGLPQVLKAAAGEIGGVGIGLIGGTLALAAAFALARKAQERLEAGIKATLDTEIELAGFLATATDEEKKARLETARATLEALEAEKKLAEERSQGREDVEGVVDMYTKFFPQLRSLSLVRGTVTDVATSGTASSGFALLGETGIPILDEFGQSTAEYLTQARLASDATQEANTSLRQASLEVSILEDALRGQTVVTKEQIELERQLADERRKQQTSNIVQINKQIIEAQQDANRLLAEGNKEALDDKVESLQQELALAEAYHTRIDQLYKNATGLDKDLLGAELDALTIEQAQKERLIEIYSYSSDAISTNANAMRDFAGEIIKGIGATRSLRDMVNDIQASTTETVKLNQDLATIAQKGADKITDIRRSLSSKEADLLSQLSQSLADARTKANQAIEDADQKHTDSLLDLERDYADERAKIIKDASREINRAIGDRDVLGFTQARQARNDQLDDARTNFDKQRRELQLSYERQLRDISINLQRQENELRTRYNRQLEAARQAAQASIQLENQRIQAELRLKQQGHQAMLQAEQSFVQTQIAMMQNLATSAASIFGNLAGAVANAQNIAASGTSGALNILSGSNTPVNVSGGNTSNANINQTNHFPSGVNSQQIVDQIVGQIANLF